MNLVSFRKNKKQKRMIIGSIIGILIVIGSITLYKTFALYEEEKEFNVLKGQIPDFGYDIKMLSVVVDGEKSKSIPTRGLYKTQIDCSNGTRGEWDYNAWNLTLENVSENARCNITFTSNLTDEEYNQYIEAGKAVRRNTYRGKNITSYHEDGSLYEMISSGRFDDIYVGDYIVANNVKWLVADIDNYLGSGFPGHILKKHHVTIVPAQGIINAPMNDTDTTEGGYIGSKMATETLPSLVTEDGTIGKIFGNHILEYNIYLSNNSDYEWYLRKIDLMSERNIYGTTIWTKDGTENGNDNKQFALFHLKPDLNVASWLRSVYDETRFVYNNSASYTYDANASDGHYGIKPRFLIG